METIRASGVMPSSAALVSLITITAAAPSFSGQQLPAVTVPSGRNTGFSAATFSSVVPGPRAVVGGHDGAVRAAWPGVMSRCQNPSASAFSARFCDRTPNSSCSCREMPRSCGDVLRGLAHRDVDVGDLAVLAAGRARRRAPPSASLPLRSSAAANTGFLVSGQLSLLPLPNRLTHSTPAEMNASPSPALIAWKAIRVVCSDDEQYRVIVVPGRLS